MKKRKILTYGTLNSSINYDLGDKKLSLNHNDVEMNKSFIPIAVSHIFQNNNYESQYGKGFKLNIEQKLYLDNGSYILENPNGYKEEFNEIIYYLDNNGKRIYTRENGKKLTRDCITINNGVLEYNDNTIYIETKTDSGLILLNNYEGFSNSKELELRNEDIASLEEEIRQIEDALVDINYNLNEYKKYENEKYLNVIKLKNEYEKLSNDIKLLQITNNDSEQNAQHIELINRYMSLVKRVIKETVGYVDSTARNNNVTTAEELEAYYINIVDDDVHNLLNYSENNLKNGGLGFSNKVEILTYDNLIGYLMERVTKVQQNASYNDLTNSTGHILSAYFNQIYNNLVGNVSGKIEEINLENEKKNIQLQDKQIELIECELKYIFSNQNYEKEYLSSLKDYYNKLIGRSEYQIEYYNKLLEAKRYQLKIMYQQYPILFVVNQEGLTYGYNKYGYLCMIFDSFDHQLLIEADYEIDDKGNVLSIKYLDIVDSDNNKIEFIYNENNQLKRIIDDNDYYVDYEYNNGYLIGVKYPNNEEYSLSYINNRLYSINDIDNSGYRLEYDGDSLSSITKVYNHDEFYIDEIISYVYEDNIVKVSSNKSKIINHYLFDHNNTLIIEYVMKNSELHDVMTYEYDSEHCSFVMRSDSKKRTFINEQLTMTAGIRKFPIIVERLHKTDYMLYAFAEAKSNLNIKQRRITDYCSDIRNDENNKYFEIRCELIYPSYTKTFVSSFNPNIEGLQFTAIPVTLDENEFGKAIIPNSINVIVDYTNNSGTLEISNLAFLEGDYVYTKYNEAHNSIYESYSDTKTLKLIDGQDSGYYITKKEIFYSYNYKDLLETQKEVVSYEEYDTTDKLISNKKKEYSINYIYDKNKNLIRSLDSLGNVEENTYNDIGVCILKKRYHKTLPNQAFIEEIEVDENGMVLSETNELGFKNKYNYIKNTPVSVETPGGNIIAMNNSINSTTISTDIDGVENYNSSVYDKGRLVEYITNNMSYKYTYDYKGRESNLYINDKLYVSFEYIEDIVNSKLSFKTIYTNGDGYEKITDLDGKTLEINIITNYNASLFIKYQYDDNDNLINELHYGNDQVLTYSYNYIDNTLVSITTPHYTKTSNNDVYGNNIKSNYQLEDSNITYNNTYDEDNKLTSIDYNDDNIQTISYDKLNRLVNLDNPVIKDNYNYLSKNGRTTNLININNKKIGNNYQRYKYQYDKEANITHKLENHNNTWYHYDKLNRLIREDNQALNQTITYELDSNGNILSKTIYPYTTKEEIIEDGIIIDYHYDNYNDILKSYNNELISYDDLGNPIIYRNNNLKWNNKQLTKFKDISFKYNVNGIRTEKITNNKSIKYILDGNKLLKEIITTYNSIEDVTIDENSTISTSTEEITYIYGVNGIIGFDYKANNITKRYYFNKNIFNDIIEIYDSNNNLVGKYEYDAYGNHKIITNIDNIANINPIRYRGYYYDKETNLYYLESRYYDPEVARFISMDSIEYLEPDNINGLNLYAYCMNNPIMYADTSGCFPVLACILGLTALVGLGLTIGGVASDNNLMTAIGLTMVAIPALISGGIALACVGAWGTMAIGGITAFAGVGTGLFASAEYQEAFTGNNWIIDTTGMSEGFYNGLMLTTASIATAGTFASLAGVGKYTTAANGWGSVTKNGKTISSVQNMRRHFIKHVIKEKRYTLGTNIYAYSNNARFLNNTINVWKVSKTSGNLIGRAILNGKNAKLIRDVVTGLILSLC